MKKRDNRGFSLVELLIAIAVLALIITPMIHSFVTSFRVNARSRIQMRATVLAQNEMELFEKEKIEDIIDMVGEDGSTPLYTYTSDESEGSYTFERKGIRDDGSSDGKKFDVYVSLTPDRNDSAGRYYDQNTTEVIQINKINGASSATYAENIRRAGVTAGLEEEVQAIFKGWKDSDPAFVSLGDVDYAEDIQRTITVQIAQGDLGDGMITKVRVIYEYKVDASHKDLMPPGCDVYKTETVIFDNAQNYDEDGNRIELENLYLFYGPRYEAGTGNEDIIVIENDAMLPIDIYVVRQDMMNEAGTAVEETPSDYKPTLIIKDGLDGGKTYAKYWTNLKIDGVGESGLGSAVGLEFENVGGAGGLVGRDNIIEAASLRPLGSKEAKDRIYIMEVEVFEEGKDPLVDSPVVSLTGSKLE